MVSRKPSESPVVRLSLSTYRYLKQRSRAEGKTIGRLIDEAVRPRPEPDARQILEYIQDLLDDQYVAQAMRDEENREWVPLEEVARELGMEREKGKPQHG